MEVRDEIGLISNQSAAWLGWSRFAQALLCAHLCNGINILRMWWVALAEFHHSVGENL